MRAVFTIILCSSTFYSPISFDKHALHDSTLFYTTTISLRLMPIVETDDDKVALQKLMYAQKVASELFDAVERNKMIVPGKSESQLNKEIEKLALDKFGIEKHWHKKIVRSGENTMVAYHENPPDRVIQADDIVIIDYGIVVDGWESDFARTYVLGNDARKIKMKNDVEQAWAETRTWINAQTKLSAADLFRYTRTKANEYGWTSAGDIAGHIVGKFPHEQPIDPKSLELDVHPDNPNDIFLKDAKGNKRHWILEIHFVDKANKIGGYMEQLI